MMAITIWQPWASLIAAGAKPYEFRTWAAPLAYVGQRIGIHAANRRIKKSEVQELLFSLKSYRGFGTAMDPEKAIPIVDRALSTPGSFPIGAVICTAVIGEPKLAIDLFNQVEEKQINPNVWAWPLTDIEPVKDQEPILGHQGFWRWR